ncbi:MAG: prolipoprotein diacylglyceryl transferase [Desulfovibrio sp.]|jgi:phosphatidylglycerol:prolipoprotein diacylglycerol transferase|nr:prolipoprotein diacylglyceryl transferase [Desulfovibrio sp.]
MLSYPQFSPDLFSLGPISLRWYGVMYLLGFGAACLLGRRRIGAFRTFTKHQFDDLLTFGIFGVILGARLGYVFFYQPAYYLANPLEIAYLWHGGMSFHGGLLGVMLAQWLAGRRYGRGFFETMDFMAPLVPPGLFFGRLGNFINGELWGKVTDVPWAMVFPGAGPLPRHPSQLYEAALEGAALFAILWAYSSKPRPTMAVSGVFALGYGLFRCFVEFFRQPDAHLGYLAFGFVTMGMALCLPLVLLGCLLLFAAYGKRSGAVRR